MARLCTGCATTFIAGTAPGLGTSITLKRNGSTFEAIAPAQVGSQSLGTVDVPMAAPTFGYAVKSHDADPNHITEATFTLP